MIRFIFTLFLVPLVFIVRSQGEVTDARDHTVYQTAYVAGHNWMLDNLNLKTSLSMSLQNDHEFSGDISGRYYHLHELDSVCPAGWHVATKQDWIDYLKLIVVTDPDSSLHIQEVDVDEITEVPNDEHPHYFFNDANFLEIRHTGWNEGGVWFLEDPDKRPNATFWATEPERDELERTHIHIAAPWARIHRHKHHLRPKQEKKLRRFMVRCVEDEG